MIKGKELLFSMFVIVAAMVCVGLCTYHYGMGVEPFYEEQLENMAQVVQDAQWLENGTIVEQIFTNRASYMVGVDLIFINTGEGAEGTLYIQLCSPTGELLAQKREQLEEIEGGQFHTVRFLEYVDVEDYENLLLRIFVEENNQAPALLTVFESASPEDSLICIVNGEIVEGSLAVNYLYGDWKYVGYKWKDNGTKEALTASILLVILVSFILIFLFCNRKRIHFKSAVESLKKDDNIRQILYILDFFAVFWGSSVIYKIRNRENIPLWVYVYIVLIAGITGMYFYLRRKKNSQKGEFFTRALQDKGLNAVVVLSTLIRIPLFLHTQLLDGAIYYGVIQQGVCSGFEYTLSYIWKNFRLARHYSIVYTFFVAIGEFLLPDNMTGVLIVMLVLTDCALICIYKMLRNYWIKLPEKEAAIGTMLVSVCPLFLGLFSNISLEHLLFVFTVFLFYAEYKKQPIMKLVWLISIMMTKETGVVIAVGYLFVHVCAHLYNTIKSKEKNKIYCFFSDFNLICTGIAIILLCLFVIKQNGLFTFFGMNQKSDGNLLFEYIKALPENIPLVLQKAKILFILHFEWIPVLIIIVCILYSVIKRQKILSFPGKSSLLGTLGIFILSNLYLTHWSLARYHIYSAAMIWVLAYILLFKAFRRYLNHVVYRGISVVMIVLMLIQNFYFIDPLTNLAFDQYDTGKGKMIATEIKGGNFGDAFTTNFRHTYLYGLIDAMLQGSNFDAKTKVIIPYEKDYMYFYAYHGYDTVHKRRVFCAQPDGEKILAMEHVFLGDILQEEQEELPERGIMYFLPYIECNEQAYVEQAEQFYEIGDRQEVSNWGGKMAYYVLERRKQVD